MSRFVLVAVAVYALVLFPVAPALAQALTVPGGTDLEAPLIKHDPPTFTAPTAAPLTLEAVVTDNQGVHDVTLFYRPLGSSDYATINMATTGKNIYAATIPKEQVVDPGMEYYIQASDTAGNTALRGFSFDPLVVRVAPGGSTAPAVGQTPAATPPSAEQLAMHSEAPATTPWYKKWWVWAIVGGVVVAGAAAGGGGGGGGSSSSPPTTGSATITVPTP